MSGACPVLLSPHLDDAVLSAWSVLRRPGPLRVVNVFAGVPAPDVPLGHWDARSGAADSAARVRERIAEDRAALAHAGHEPLNLDFLDDQYRDAPVPAAKLLGALTEAAAGATELFVTAGIRGHVDHLAARTAAQTLARELGVPLTLYAEQPYATRHGWPGWVDGAEPNAEAEAEWEQAVGTLASTPEVDRLPPHEFEAKLAALRTYRTQFDALIGHSRYGLDSPDAIGIEVRFRLAT